VNVDQYKKWNQQYENEILAGCRELVIKAENSNPDLIVWPETSLPYLFDENRQMRQWLRDTLALGKAYHLIGSVAYEGKKCFNSAFLINSDKWLTARYDKAHLLPFGEIIPFEKYIVKFVKPLEKLGGFTPGTKSEPLRVGIHRFGAMICYESIFPEITREYARQNVDMLVNITNDAWFLKTSAPYQHFAMNVFRAVESKIPVIRCANTGISAYIDASGRIVQESVLFDKGVLQISVKLPAYKNTTFYENYGDIFALFFLAVSGIITLLSFIPKTKKRQSYGLRY
jgi:apolipoprotein N-acyltransferase